MKVPGEGVDLPNPKPYQQPQIGPQLARNAVVPQSRPSGIS